MEGKNERSHNTMSKRGMEKNKKIDEII